MKKRICRVTSYVIVLSLIIAIIQGVSLTVNASGQVYTENFDDNDISNLIINGVNNVTKSVQDGKVHINQTSGESMIIDDNSMNIEDGIYEFKLKPGTEGRCGGVIRYQSPNDYIWFGYQNDGYWRIRERKDAFQDPDNYDILFQHTINDLNAWHTVKIEYIGRDFIIWLDDNQIYQGELNLLKEGSGKVGFVEWSVSDSWFDDIVQQELVKNYITSFSVPGQLGQANIDKENHTIHFKTELGIDITSLVTNIGIPEGATINTESGEIQDFTNPVIYTVTSPEGEQQVWTISCINQTINIVNESITVTIDKNFPQPLMYKSNTDGATLFGADTATIPKININGTDYNAEVTSFTSNGALADYEVNISDLNVSIHYNFILEGNQLVREITNITGDGESDVRTIRITTPIMTVKNDQIGSSAAWYADNGTHNVTDVIENLSSLSTGNKVTPWAFLYTNEAVGAAYCNSAFDIPFEVKVQDISGIKCVSIYDREYYYRLKDNYKPGIWFESKTYIGSDNNNNNTIDWQDGALWLREQLPQMPENLKRFFKNGGNWTHVQVAFVKDAKKTSNTATQTYSPFNTLAAQQRQFYYLTDGLAYQSYECAGWQGRGHDWNWPDWSEQQVNPGLGGREALDKGRSEMAKYNGDLSFHVNQSDMTEFSNAYNSELRDKILAKSSWGIKKLSYGSNVFGFNAWFISHYKDFRNGTALKRIDDFVGNYWAPTIIYQDVMIDNTSEDVGYGVAEERYAKKMEIDQWKENGTFATTEYYTPEKRINGGFIFKRYATDSIIDHFINAGQTILQNNYYGTETFSLDKGEAYDKLWSYMVSSRARCGNGNTATGDTKKELTEDTYLYTMTNGYMTNYELQEYKETTNSYQVLWGDSLIAKVDKLTNNFSLRDKEVLIADGTDRFIPAVDGSKKIYVYSKYGNTRIWKLPSNWNDVSKVERYQLTTSGRVFIDCINVIDDAVLLTTLSETPYVLEPCNGNTPPVGPVNLAVNKAITVSSVSNNNIADNAIDNDISSLWTPNSTNNEWLEVDFERETDINRVEIIESGNNITSYEIQYWDEDSWKTTYTGTSIGTGMTNVFPIVRSNKIRFMVNSANLQPSISEFKLFADPNLAVTAKVTASSNSEPISLDGQYPSYRVGNIPGDWTHLHINGDFTFKYDVQPIRAIDTTTKTYWAAKNETGGAWLQLNFKNETKVNRIVLSEEENNITSYRIQYWNNNEWEVVYSGTNMGGMKEINFEAIVTTRLRLIMDSAIAEPCIQEFRAYNVGDIQLPQEPTRYIDLSDNGNDAFSINNVMEVQGVIGKAIHLDGQCCLEAENSLSLNAPVDGITLETWIYKPSAAPSTYTRIIDKSIINTNSGYMIDITNTDKLRFVGGGACVVGNSTIPRDEWIHIAATYSATTKAIKFYINGELDGTANGTGNIISTDTKLHIGSDANLTSKWRGYIDEVRIYDRELTQQEIIEDKEFNYSLNGLKCYYAY
ncbi:hypothetical protein AN1V17_07710 [Vallitalea sediminicola]